MLDLWFEDCCINHDSCYSGDKGQCSKTRAECDNEFCECANAACSGSMMYLQCKSAAKTYCNTVKEKGGPYYINARSLSKCDIDCIPDQPMP